MTQPTPAVTSVTLSLVHKQSPPPVTCHCPQRTRVERHTPMFYHGDCETKNRSCVANVESQRLFLVTLNITAVQSTVVYSHIVCSHMSCFTLFISTLSV